jgi:hypothetical protein
MTDPRLNDQGHLKTKSENSLIKRERKMLWKKKLASCLFLGREKREAMERSEREAQSYAQVIHNTLSFRGFNLI